MEAKDLSVLIPAYNEEKSLPILLDKLQKLEFSKPINFEVIVIDDASTDKTFQTTLPYKDKGVTVIRLTKNSGKGAAVRTGISRATGRHLIIQDADLEYFPSDIPKLLDAAMENPGSAIFGSRVLGAKDLGGLRGVIRLWPKQSMLSWIFNYILSCWLFFIRGCWFTDLLTGYKLYPAELFRDWLPETSGFETDHEITCQLLNSKKEIFEVPIQYLPRSKIEGKKIGAQDGFIALKTFWRYRK